MCITNKPLTAKGKLVFPVVNSLKLHLTGKVEVGCLRHPGASTIGSQLLDGDRSHGWQIQATQP